MQGQTLLIANARDEDSLALPLARSLRDRVNGIRYGLDGIAGAIALSHSPNGKHVYVAGFIDGGVYEGVLPVNRMMLAGGRDT